MPVVTKYYCDRCGKELIESEKIISCSTPYVTIVMLVYDPSTEKEKKYTVHSKCLCPDCYEYIRDALDALRLKLAGKDFQWETKK